MGGGGGLIDTEQKGCEWIIHDHDCDLWVAMVGWVDAPFSDWGDFRRRHAIDISSFFSDSFRSTATSSRQTTHGCGSVSRQTGSLFTCSVSLAYNL